MTGFSSGIWDDFCSPMTRYFGRKNAAVFTDFSTISFILVLFSVRIEGIDTHCSCKLVKKSKQRLWDRNYTWNKNKVSPWISASRILSDAGRKYWIKNWKTLQSIWYFQNWQNIYLLFIVNKNKNKNNRFYPSRVGFPPPFPSIRAL